MSVNILDLQLTPRTGRRCTVTAGNGERAASRLAGGVKWFNVSLRWAPREPVVLRRRQMTPHPGGLDREEEGEGRHILE